MKMLRQALAVAISCIHLLVLCSAMKPRVECDEKPDCVYCSFENCIITNFSQHLPTNVDAVQIVNFRSVALEDIEGCKTWLSQIPIITNSLWIEFASAGLGECLTKLGQSLQFARPIYELKLHKIEGVDEAWLRTQGLSLFRDLVDNSVEELGLQDLGLASANAIIPLRVGEKLSYAQNNLKVIASEDFSDYDLTDLKVLDLTNNQICVFHLAALRYATNLRKVALAGNPLYVPSDSLLQLRDEDDDVAMVTNSGPCAEFAKDYAACRVLKVKNWDYIHKRAKSPQNYSSLVTFYSPNGAPKCALQRLQKTAAPKKRIILANLIANNPKKTPASNVNQNQNYSIMQSDALRPNSPATNNINNRQIDAAVDANNANAAEMTSGSAGSKLSSSNGTAPKLVSNPETGARDTSSNNDDNKIKSNANLQSKPSDTKIDRPQLLSQNKIDAADSTSIKQSVVKECPIQVDCDQCEYRKCVLKNFDRQRRRGDATSISSLIMHDVTIMDAQGCADWIRQLPEIANEFRLTVVRGQMRECLQLLNQPIRLNSRLQKLRISFVEGIDDSWLRTHGEKLFSNLRNGEVDQLQYDGLGLILAASPIGPVRVTGMLSLWNNRISSIPLEAFRSYDLTSMETLQLTNNQLCMLQLRALGGMSRLQHVSLEDNPLYVPADVLLQWLREFPDGLLVSNAAECQGYRDTYRHCRVANTSTWVYDYSSDRPKSSTVSLLLGSEGNRDCGPQVAIQSVLGSADDANAANLLQAHALLVILHVASAFSVFWLRSFCA